jgi:YHS domain-containing protein
MLRVLLFAVLIVFVARALAKIWRGVMEGLDGRSYADGAAVRATQMVRDPVCGTFVLPDRAVVLDARGQKLYFCSTRCRDDFRADPARHLTEGPERGSRSAPSRGAEGPERGHPFTASRRA